MKNALFALFIFTLNNTLFGQTLKNTVQNENILSVQCYPQGFELSYPILNTTSKTSLILSFDLMGNEQPALAYRLIHCDVNWQESKIPTREFLENTLNEFEIEDYEFSLGTKWLYTHYTAKIPTEQLKISGNYIVQVFPQDDSETVWLQQRFLYAELLTTITGTAERELSQRYKTMQRINFKVDYNNKDFSSPQSNFTAVVVQNFRWETAKRLKPLFFNLKELNFNYIDKKSRFEGNYEFPYFDTSLLTESSPTLKSIEKDDEGKIHCYLTPNATATDNYFYQKDMNGNFTIKADNVYNKTTEGEYVWTHFTLLSEQQDLPIYVVGRFNNWTTEEPYQLFYDEQLKCYHTGFLLKQGVYNYTFVSKTADGKLKNLLGSYGETENDYYIFVYYKDPRLRTEKLVGWTRLNTAP